jgi:hypothetical protein
MNDQRDPRQRQLANGTSFKARLCPGLFAATSLIEAAKGISDHGNSSESDDIGGGNNNMPAAYPTRHESVSVYDLMTA